jgi:hypothetical protein
MNLAGSRKTTHVMPFWTFDRKAAKVVGAELLV